jgi:molybdopterin molybdotransferase
VLRFDITEVMELEAAIDCILAQLPPAQPETVVLAEAHRRILAEHIASPIDLPGFDNSAMDGYAVRAADLHGAGESSPVILRLRGRVPAGEVYAGEIVGGDCVRIFTGSPIPPGADAVVMQEDVRLDEATPECIRFMEPVRPWENVRLRGEDLRQGASVGEMGDELNAGRLCLLAAAGLNRVRVGQRPRVGLLATGSELVEAGQPLPPGGIYESNRCGLAALTSRAGGVPKLFPLVADTPTATQSALQNAFRECDFVVTSGGVSVGEMDFIKTAFENLNGQLQFWRVAIRPGRPFVFGRWQEKFLFGLPGNPVSAFVTFLLLVRPALARWQGVSETGLRSHTAALAEPLANPGHRRHFVRVTVDASGQIRSAGGQGSHILSSLAAANGLVDLPPKAIFPVGAVVPVLRWE